MFRRIVVALAIISAARCALYSDVAIQPLMLVPTSIDRGADIRDMVRRADYLRAVGYAPAVDARERKDATELIALAQAELAANRTSAARRHFRAAMNATNQRTVYADAAWGLSEVDYMENSFETSLDWANVAMEYGLVVLQWHLDYLKALSHVQVYRHATGPMSDEVRMRMGHPDVPRVDVRINGSQAPTMAVIDSGAVISIVSQRLAKQLALKRIPTARGTFYGLLGEPISVEFALIDTLDIGAIGLQNVPVAVMPDDKMTFLMSGRKTFDMDFLLGANLLKEFRFEFDYARDRLRVTQLTALDKKPAEDQNLFFEGFRPNVRGTVNKHGWFLFVLDTGSEVTFLNESRIASTPINLFAPRVHNATLQGLGGAKKHGSKVDDVEVGVDKWAGLFRSLPMYSGGEKERAVGIVGENFLKNFRAVIDFGRMRVDLERR
ncbi:MAG TPA: aspartyl protease family protein [Thermoanaerobaculia bacterium]|nr:aspartyl protease family protein [Thermoanaerobaculia bacterium]